jgi:hypothetical protein
VVYLESGWLLLGRLFTESAILSGEEYHHGVCPKVLGVVVISLVSTGGG